MSDNKQCPVGGKGIGGQAVIEGVMMRGRELYAMAVRGPEGDIKLEKTFFTKKNYTAKYTYLQEPILKIWQMPAIS